MTNFEEQIKLLVELQALDSHILKMESELEYIPAKIKESQESFKEKTGNLKKLEDAVKALQLKRKEKEGDLEGKEATIKKYQTQMYQVKTNKEYTAFQEAIGRVKADNSLIEEEILKIFDQLDIENKKIIAEKEVLKKEEGRLAEEKKQLEGDAGRIKGELAVVRKQRNELAAKVDKQVLARYERILKNRDGLAVVPVVNEACHGCFRIMPPQVINEIRMKEGIVVCENCTRILYIEE